MHMNIYIYICVCMYEYEGGKLWGVVTIAKGDDLTKATCDTTFTWSQGRGLRERTCLGLDAACPATVYAFQ